MTISAKDFAKRTGGSVDPYTDPTDIGQPWPTETSPGQVVFIDWANHIFGVRDAKKPNGLGPLNTYEFPSYLIRQYGRPVNP